MSFNKKIIKTATKEAIVKTIAFFDMFDYPLTGWEIWKFGYKILNIGYRDVRSILDGGELNNIIDSKNGFYFLYGRELTVKTRMARYNYSGRKFKRALKIAKLFKFIPWIKMIAVGNIIGSHNLKDGSDIDLFIITKQGRIWITRFFCVVITKLLGFRPKADDMRDKICLSFFVSEDGADLRELMLGGGSLDFSFVYSGGAWENPKSSIDIYFIYWLAGLTPIYDAGGAYEKFIQANYWLKQYLPNWRPMQAVRQRDADKNFSCFYYDLVDLLFGGLEQNVKKFQLKKLPNGLKELMNKDTRVVINDRVLKLHIKDRRKEYRKKWQKSLIQIELTKWMLN